MVNHPRQQSVDVGVRENLVTLRKKTTSHMLEITCTGREGFEVTIDGTKSPPTNRSGMARTVINWLKT
jgi:hypothetical protein